MRNPMLWTIVLFILTLFYVRTRFLVVELSLEVHGLRQEKLLLENEKRKLLLELSTLQDPERIEKKAYKMGMTHEGKRREVIRAAP
jgi:cell division protein FtsL